MTAAIELVVDPRERPVGNGVVRRVLPWRRRRMVGPFIFADLIGPDELARDDGVVVSGLPTHSSRALSLVWRAPARGLSLAL